MMTQVCSICICNYCVSHYLTKCKDMEVEFACLMCVVGICFVVNTMGLCLVLCCLGVGKCMFEMIEKKYFLKRGGLYIILTYVSARRLLGSCCSSDARSFPSHGAQEAGPDHGQVPESGGGPGSIPAPVSQTSPVGVCPL